MSDSTEEKGAPLYMGEVLTALGVVSEIGLSNAGSELMSVIKQLDFYEEGTGMYFTVSWEGPMTQEQATERGRKHQEVLPVGNYPRRPAERRGT